MPTSINLKAKLYNPCKKFLQILRFRLKRPIIRPLFQFRKPGRPVAEKTRPKKRTRGLLFIFRRWASSKQMDEVGELMSSLQQPDDQVLVPRMEHILFPSPMTPAYVKSIRGAVGGSGSVTGNADVDDACRSFENYLAEMIVEEGKVKDLVDVEELLYCWRNLKCPVFHDLVCRFYGELCMDLFSGQAEGNDDTN